jgi:PTS system nitrogen regulatory IIA component
MNIEPYLEKQCIQLGTEAANKDELLREIAHLAKNNDVLKSLSEDDIYSKLKEREEISSTGFSKGIAIPHCSFEKLDTFVVGILITPDGIAFESIDGSPTKIFVFIIGPVDRRNEHISILSGFSKVLINQESIDRLLSASSADEIYDFLIQHVQFKQQKPAESEEKVLFHLFVQDEQLFEDILQLFSASASGAITVIESNNAGQYLNAMPLFAAIWTEQSTSFNRLILAVVDKSLSNDIIRQINTIAPAEKSGLLITVQELFYASGSIDF